MKKIFLIIVFVLSVVSLQAQSKDIIKFSLSSMRVAKCERNGNVGKYTTLIFTSGYILIDKRSSKIILNDKKNNLYNKWRYYDVYVEKTREYDIYTYNCLDGGGIEYNIFIAIYSNNSINIGITDGKYFSRYDVWLDN